MRAKTGNISNSKITVLSAAKVSLQETTIFSKMTKKGVLSDAWRLTTMQRIDIERNSKTNQLKRLLKSATFAFYFYISALPVKLDKVG